MRLAWLSWLAFLPTACVDPLTDDDVPPRDILFDPSADEPPTALEYTDPRHGTIGDADHEIGNRIDEHDGVDGTLVPRLSGFAGGARVWYWDFGATPTFTAPLWELVNPFAEGDEPELIDHPPIWDVVPGDRAYSPYWRVFTVTVTDKYNGERLTSRRAIDEAVRLGLVLPPQRTSLYVNCPVLDERVQLQVKPDSHPVEVPCDANEDATCIAPKWAYYRGIRVAYYDVSGPCSFDPDVEMPEADVYSLRRETEALPISEPVRGVDLTGDDDRVDTNDVLDPPLCDPAQSPIRRTTRVFVPADYESIDSNASETEAAATSADDLFPDGEPDPDVVRGVERTDELRNLAIERTDDCSCPVD